MIRATIIVSGIVQGVGFRSFAWSSARSLRIKGHIQNLEDQTVKITAESSKDNIQSLVQTIRNAKEPAFVEDVNVTYGEATGEFKSFKTITRDLVEELVEWFSGYHALFMASIDKQRPNA